jgi:hypothetical protein
MKYILFAVVFFLSKTLISQIKQIDSVCRVCDTSAVRYCGAYGFQKKKIKTSKLKEDIDLLKRAESFLANKDTIFSVPAGKKKELRQRIAFRDSFMREERIYANYFEIRIYVTLIKDSLIKGITISRSVTAECKNFGHMFYFDTRLVKRILPALKLPYVYNGCVQILVNTLCDVTADGRCKMPTKIKSNILDANIELPKF